MAGLYVLNHHLTQQIDCIDLDCCILHTFMVDLFRTSPQRSHTTLLDFLETPVRGTRPKKVRNEQIKLKVQSLLKTSDIGWMKNIPTFSLIFTWLELSFQFLRWLHQVRLLIMTNHKTHTIWSIITHGTLPLVLLVLLLKADIGVWWSGSKGNALPLIYPPYASSCCRDA